MESPHLDESFRAGLREAIKGEEDGYIHKGGSGKVHLLRTHV
jgi:hypothetical protein